MVLTDVGIAARGVSGACLGQSGILSPSRLAFLFSLFTGGGARYVAVDFPALPSVVHFFCRKPWSEHGEIRSFATLPWRIRSGF